MVQSQAYMMSTIDYFTMLGWLFLALLVIIWLARPPFGAKPGAAASGHLRTNGIRAGKSVVYSWRRLAIMSPSSPV